MFESIFEKRDSITLPCQNLYQRVYCCKFISSHVLHAFLSAKLNCFYVANKPHSDENAIRRTRACCQYQPFLIGSSFLTDKKVSRVMVWNTISISLKLCSTHS